MSSRTTSIPLSCNVFSAACDVPTVATTSNPSTRPTYAVWASAAIGSSSTTSTRKTSVIVAPATVEHPTGGQPHGERRTRRPRHGEGPAEPVDRLTHEGQPDAAATRAALILRRPPTQER